MNIVIIVSRDLLFLTKVRSTGETLGVRVEQAGSAEQLQTHLDAAAQGQTPFDAAAPMQTRCDVATQSQAQRDDAAHAQTKHEVALTRLVIVDLDLPDEFASDCIRLAVNHPTRPRVIAYGSHVRADLLQAARDAGAHDVMPRSRFAAELPALLRTPVD